MKFIYKFIKYLLIVIVSIYIIFFIILSIFPKPHLLEDIKFSKALYDDSEHLLYLSLTPDEQYRVYTPLAQIPDNLIKATLLQEDQYYYYHQAINPISLTKAFIATYILKTRKIGASTITMQVVRLKDRIYTKTISGKLIQIFRALQLEHYYSKSQILEAYLNLAPYGGNIEGAGAASLIYFGTPLINLNLSETLTLAVIPQNPVKRSPSLIQHKQLVKARYDLFVRWIKKYPNSFSQTQKALIELPLQLQHNTPFLAPHFITSVLAKFPQQNNLHTTLNLKLQNIITQIADTYSKTHNLNNYAILLLDSRNMEVKSLIGSADFFNPQIQGQVNGTQSKRSPGSTLKPFIYALALQQGLIHPLTILKDTPTRFGVYSPENFDRDYLGPISATNALIASRNIPAITLMDELKHPSLYQFLREADIRMLKPESQYGLSLAIGDGEVTMQELVQLYAILINGGTLRSLRFLETESKAQGIQLLTPEASYLVLEMLKSNPRPSIMSNAAKISKLPIYWKTGTSSHFRDAWAIGVVGPYVLAVWAGDFANKDYQQFIGLETAAPLFFGIIDAIEAQTGQLQDIRQNPAKLNLVHTQVCEASGLLPTSLCPKTVDTWFIPGVSPIKKDNIFREVLIDTKTGLRACQVSPTTRFIVYEFWPSDLEKLFEKAGIHHITPPPYNSQCNQQINTVEGLPPRIITPQANLVYSLHIANATNSQIPLMAITDHDVKTIYWFMNQTYIGQSTPNQSFNWIAKPGEYKLRAVDDHGLSDVVPLKVELVK